MALIQPKSRERRSLCANLYKLLAVIRVGWIITVLFLLKTNMFWNTINILLFSKKAFVKEIIEYFTHIFRLKICRGFIALKTNIIAKKIEYRKFYSVYSIRGNCTHSKNASNSVEELWQKHWFSRCYSVEMFWKVWETDDKGVWDAILNKIYHTETFTYLLFNKIKGYYYYYY